MKFTTISLIALSAVAAHAGHDFGELDTMLDSPSKAPCHACEEAKQATTTPCTEAKPVPAATTSCEEKAPAPAPAPAATTSCDEKAPAPAPAPVETQQSCSVETIVSVWTDKSVEVRTDVHVTGTPGPSPAPVQTSSPQPQAPEDDDEECEEWETQHVCRPDAECSSTPAPAPAPVPTGGAPPPQNNTTPDVAPSKAPVPTQPAESGPMQANSGNRYAIGSGVVAAVAGAVAMLM